MKIGNMHIGLTQSEAATHLLNFPRVGMKEIARSVWVVEGNRELCYTRPR
jgi:hypothetical protein